MEPALDEASLVPCPKGAPGLRIQQLADTLRALDGLGVPRLLRSVRDAADRDLGGARGLRYWCFDSGTPRDAGRFVASRLDKAPFIDGPDGLFSRIEGERVIEPTIDGTQSFGGGYVALKDSVLVILPGSTWSPTKPVIVHLVILADDGEEIEDVPVDAADCAAEVSALADAIRHKVEAGLAGGPGLVERLPELCPCLVLGERAADQLAALTGSELWFSHVLRHLRALDQAAREWEPGTQFCPEGVNYSVESKVTLDHGTYGPMRVSPTPVGFAGDQWTLHTKIPCNIRLYYKLGEVGGIGSDAKPFRQMRVAIGYVGPHLPTLRFHE
jgi:hypothetical protein